MPVQQNMGKKPLLLSHLRKINRKLFKESLPNCIGSFKYFSSSTTLNLKHDMKPTLNNNWPDTAVIHRGLNDVDFINYRSEITVKDTAENIIKIALLCKE